MKLDYDEMIIFRPKRNLFTKIFNTILFSLTLYALSYAFLLAIITHSFEHIIITGIMLLISFIAAHMFFSCVLLTNKRILYQNIFFIPKSIWLKDIIDIHIQSSTFSGGSALMFDLQNIRKLVFKLSGKFFKRRVLTPEPDELMEITLEYIFNNLKDNSLSEDWIYRLE